MRRERKKEDYNNEKKEFKALIEMKIWKYTGLKGIGTESLKM